MGQLADHFRHDFTDGSTDFDMTTSTVDGSQPDVVTRVRVFYNADTMVRYVGYYMSAETYSVTNACVAIRDVRQIIASADSSVQMWIGNDHFDPVGVRVSDLPFSGRVILYIDTNVSDEDRTTIVDYAAQTGVTPQIRDRKYSESMTKNEKPAAFISHDSRDKDELARPLAEALHSALCPVWFDEFALRPGDSLRESIDKGLRDAPRCILLLTPNFLQNPGWTKGEFNAAMNRHFREGGNLLLPVWHNVSASEVDEYSTLITDIYAINTSIGLDAVANRLLGVLKPPSR